MLLIDQFTTYQYEKLKRLASDMGVPMTMLWLSFELYLMEVGGLVAAIVKIKNKKFITDCVG